MIGANMAWAPLAVKSALRWDTGQSTRLQLSQEGYDPTALTSLRVVLRFRRMPKMEASTFYPEATCRKPGWITNSLSSAAQPISSALSFESMVWQGEAPWT